MKIKVSEIFGPTVQGEGKNAGKPVAFLRLALCNLHCIWCDTPFTWNWLNSPWEHSEKFDKKKEINPMTIEEIIERLEEIGEKHIIISGGEPLMQQKKLIPLFEELKDRGYFLEMETNGTLVPDVEMEVLVDQFNCSPKLANSKDTEELRIRPDALLLLSAMDKVNFKFVITSYKDMAEVITLVKRFKLREVRLMPECRTPEEHARREPLLRWLCEQYGFIYCERLSILQSGATRGV